MKTRGKGGRSVLPGKHFENFGWRLPGLETAVRGAGQGLPGQAQRVTSTANKAWRITAQQGSSQGLEGVGQGLRRASKAIASPRLPGRGPEGSGQGIERSSTARDPWSLLPGKHLALPQDPSPSPNPNPSLKAPSPGQPAFKPPLSAIPNPNPNPNPSPSPQPKL